MANRFKLLLMNFLPWHRSEDDFKQPQGDKRSEK
jgi:hypothetical protein